MKMEVTNSSEMSIFTHQNGVISQKTNMFFKGKKVADNNNKYATANTCTNI
jgi:hypothetical protein